MGGVKDEKSEYYEGSLKNPIFRGKGGGGGLMENQYMGGGTCLKRGCMDAWTVCRFKGGLMCTDCETHTIVSSLIVYFNDVCVIQFSGSELCIWHSGGIPSFKKS